MPSATQNNQNGCEAIPTTAGSKSIAINRSFEPGLVTNVDAVGGRPPATRQVPLGFARVEPPHGRRRFEPHRPRISQRYPVGGPIPGDVSDLEAARHERYGVLVGATGSKSPTRTSSGTAPGQTGNDTQSRSEHRKIIRNLSPNTAI